MFQEIWPLLSVAIAIIVLLILIMKLQLNTFVALVITAMVTGILLGMPFDKIVATIETGMGGTLGHIALIFGLGAMLGKLLADGGGATQIADTLIAKLGKKYVQWAMVIASFIIGIALFFAIVKTSVINTTCLYDCETNERVSIKNRYAYGNRIISNTWFLTATSRSSRYR